MKAREMRRRWSLAIVVVAGCLGLFTASDLKALETNTVIFRQGVTNELSGGVVYAGCEDNWLKSNSSSLNYGASASMYLKSSSDSSYAVLIRFDLTSMVGCIPVSATLSIWPSNVVGSPTGFLYAVTSANGDWVEGSANGSSQAGSSCWLYKAYETLGAATWAGLPGCYSNGVDYVDAALDSKVLTKQLWGSFEITDAALLNSWVNGNTNGLLLRCLGDSSDYAFLYSSENSEAYRPYLEVKYIIPPKGTVITIL